MTPPPGRVYWVTVPAQTSKHWLEVHDPEGWHHAVVKFDGDVHFRVYFNEPHENPLERYNFTDNADEITLTDLEDVITRLQSLLDIARHHFGDKWPNT